MYMQQPSFFGKILRNLEVSFERCVERTLHFTNDPGVL